MIQKDNSELFAALQNACDSVVGPFDARVLCRSISTLDPKDPICVFEDTTIAETIELLQREKIGCIVVTDREEKLLGIFSERDLLIKIAGRKVDIDSAVIGEFMTKNPTTTTFDAPLAYALNLMSHGGFRHIPLVDDEYIPRGIISVKDIIDFLVNSMTEALLTYEE